MCTDGPFDGRFIDRVFRLRRLKRKMRAAFARNTGQVFPAVLPGMPRYVRMARKSQGLRAPRQACTSEARKGQCAASKSARPGPILRPWEIANGRI